MAFFLWFLCWKLARIIAAQVRIEFEPRMGQGSSCLYVNESRTLLVSYRKESRGADESSHHCMRYYHHCMRYYKIAKIARALWLAERRVYTRVCKHDCGVKMFCFSRANQVRTNLKKFLSSKLDKVTLFTHSFVGWNLENLYKQAVSTFFRLSWHFKREKSVFWKASFCKTMTDYGCKTSCTRLWDW